MRTSAAWERWQKESGGMGCDGDKGDMGGGVGAWERHGELVCVHGD